MSFRVEDLGGRPVVVSEKLRDLGIPHAFGTRRGGASKGRFAESNMSFFNGDDRADVDANWRQLLEAVGLGASALHVLRQVHGTDVVEVEDATAPSETPFHHAGAADGLSTTRPGAALGILTADCVPVLVAFEAKRGAARRVAALHCGWRGTVAGLLPRFLKSVAAAPEVVALGPHIRRDRFEVGPELRETFRDAFRDVGVDPSEGVRAGQGDRLLVDLERLLIGQLKTAGVGDQALETAAPCTYAGEDLFFSYRRDGPGRGLLGHVVGLPGKASAPHS